MGLRLSSTRQKGKSMTILSISASISPSPFSQPMARMITVNLRLFIRGWPGAWARLRTGLLELASRAMGAAADVLLGERSEPALDLVQPGRRGGREVNVEARMTS